MADAQFNAAGRLETPVTLGMHDFGDGSVGPKSVVYDPVSGAPVGYPASSVVEPLADASDSKGTFLLPAEIVSAPNGWPVPLSGFSNPRYVAADPTDATGFDINGYQAVALSFAGTYTGQTVVHEQTLDVTGATGWFPVVGFEAREQGFNPPVNNLSAPGYAYVYPVVGVRHRVRVTALATSDMVVRIGLSTSRHTITSAVMGYLSPGTAAANLGKAEDAPHASGDVGVFVLAVRRDTPQTDTSASGDYAALQVDDKGRLWINPASYSYAHFNAANTGAIVKNATGSLRAVIVGKKSTGAGSITLYDSPSSAANLIATIDTDNIAGALPFDLKFINGLYAVIVGSPDVTVVYS